MNAVLTPRFACYFFFPASPGLACDPANEDAGAPAFGFGCFGFFGSLLLLSCPLAIGVSLLQK